MTSFSFFFFNDTATTEIYTLSLHDALPIYVDDQLLALGQSPLGCAQRHGVSGRRGHRGHRRRLQRRSEEHTSELQSPCNLVCRLLLEKKKKVYIHIMSRIVILILVISRSIV